MSEDTPSEHETEWRKKIATWQALQHERAVAYRALREAKKAETKTRHALLQTENVQEYEKTLHALCEKTVKADHIMWKKRKADRAAKITMQEDWDIKRRKEIAREQHKAWYDEKKRVLRTQPED